MRWMAKGQRKQKERPLDHEVLFDERNASQVAPLRKDKDIRRGYYHGKPTHTWDIKASTILPLCPSFRTTFLFTARCGE